MMVVMSNDDDGKNGIRDMLLLTNKKSGLFQKTTGKKQKNKRRVRPGGP